MACIFTCRHVWTDFGMKCLAPDRNSVERAENCFMTWCLHMSTEALSILLYAEYIPARQTLPGLSWLICCTHAATYSILHRWRWYKHKLIIYTQPHHLSVLIVLLPAAVSVVATALCACTLQSLYTGKWQPNLLRLCHRWLKVLRQDTWLKPTGATSENKYLLPE